MSVMNGFRAELLGRILGFQGHVFVTGGVLDGPGRDEAAARIRAVPGVTQAAPIIEDVTLAAVASGITGALVLISIKHLSTTEPAGRVGAWYAVASVLVWGPVSALVWQTPSAGAVLLLLAGSVLAVAGDWLAQMAARRAEVGLLAPVEYAAIPASAVLGMLLFGEEPGWTLLAGTLLMLAATLYLLRSGRRG